MQYNDKILITGGKGFVGSHLVDLLVKTGYCSVYSLDRASCKSININHHCSYLIGDVSDLNTLRALFNSYKFKYVFHFAGNSSVPLSNQEPLIDFQSNALGTLNLFQVANNSEVDKIIFTSSAAVYGQPIFTPVTEEHPLNPISNYALTKLYGEKLAIAYNHTYNVRSSVLRIFSTYGPRQPRYILFDLLKKIEADSNCIKMLGSPETVRDYIYVEDTANAFYKVMQSQEADGQVFNLSGGKPITILNLIQLVCQILGVNPEIRFTESSWKGDIKEFNGDISKIKTITDFEPRISLEEGIGRTIEWFRDSKLINI